MLAPLIDDKQKISLIENSGVQFLDFGLQLFATQARRQFVRQTANGPLLRLNMDGNSGKFYFTRRTVAHRKSCVPKPISRCPTP